MCEPDDLQPLSALRIGTFAYFTVKDRLPIILTKVIDHLCREKDTLSSKYGENATEDCKKIVGALSQLKNEMQTNKSITEMSKKDHPSKYDDTDIWNKELERLTQEDNGVEPKWFTSSWLYVECYMYARIHHAFSISDSLQTYDPFLMQKEKSLTDSLQASEALAAHVLSLCNADVLPTLTQQLLKQHFHQLLEVTLWGNKCDLSLSAGNDVSQDDNLLNLLEEYEPFIIENHSSTVFQLLVGLPEDQRDIVMVLDNAGFELITDLCYLTFLIEAGLATNITIHPKTRPWFVSDTTYSDITWTIEMLRDAGGSSKELANKWANYISDGRWKIQENKFWTTSFDYNRMKEIEPELYADLSKASLVIFKGDLNYRKLTGDMSWPTTTLFKTALGGFLPAPILAIRTAKGGPVVGLARDDAVRLETESADWNTSGDYGMIQFCAS